MVKNKYILLIILINIIISVIVTVVDLFRKEYLNDFNDFIALKNVEHYMSVDTLLLTKRYDYITTDGIKNFIIRGNLSNDKNSKEIVVGREDYLDLNSSKKIPVFISNLSNQIYLKDASENYYKSKFSHFLFAIYFKISLFILPLFIFYLRK